jgi:hypothetical protein
VKSASKKFTFGTGMLFQSIKPRFLRCSLVPDKTKKSFTFQPIGKERAGEHFMTVSFHKKSARVGMPRIAWRSRQQDINRLLVKDFKQAFTLNLQ